MSANDGGPAFPGFDYIDQGGKPNPLGMSLRDYFAAAALTGMIACERVRHETFKDYARIAYEAANAMLAERARKEAQP